MSMAKKQPVSSLATVPVVAPVERGAAPMAATPPPVRRESLHVRLPVETVDRVREASHRLRRERQDITDEALREWFAAHNF
jgi:hypothetical protein